MRYEGHYLYLGDPALYTDIRVVWNARKETYDVTWTRSQVRAEYIGLARVQTASRNPHTVESLIINKQWVPLYPDCVTLPVGV